MNRNLKQMLFWVSAALPLTSFAQAEVINLSTGWNNGIVPLNTLEDSWTVTRPNGTTVTPKACNFLPHWAETGQSRWISPDVNANGQAALTVNGTYTYKISFRVSAERIDCARFIIKAIGGDNRVTGVSLNGNNYTPTMPAGDNNFSPLTYSITHFLNPTHVISGMNTLTITTSNFLSFDENTQTGLNFYGELRVNDGNFNIQPVISGPTKICQGSPLSFGGSLSPVSGAATDHLWKILECDVNGNLIAGGFSWEQWFNGPPVNYTFPSSINVPCGKYYMVVLVGVRESGCANWAQDTHVFYYPCKPSAIAGTDQTVCQDECTPIGMPAPSKWTTYNWTANGSSVGSTSLITVCPTATTTYTVTTTHTSTGCSNTDQVVVTVLPNDPGFDISTNTDLPQYYTVLGSPNVMNANIFPGFGQFWSVEELDANGNSLYIIQNPNEWWPYPANCTFKGFDDYLVNYDLTPNFTDVHTTVPPAPASGRFMYNRTYRITRGTWNNNCDWNADAFILARTKNGNGNEVEVYPTEAPDFSAYVTSMQEKAAAAWTIAPNPSNGIFNLSSEAMEGSTVEVYDLFGKKIESKVIEAGTTAFALDLSIHAKGVYILNITTNGVVSTHKIILD